MNALPTTPRVAIVLVNWNGWRDTVECLSSILASDASAVADIWVVDNDSGDGSVEHIAAWCVDPQAPESGRALEGVRHVHGTPVPFREWQANGSSAPDDPDVRVTIVRSGGNLGFAGGNNAGLVAAGIDRYTHFWLLNTDTVIRHDALQRLLLRAAADPSVGIVGSTLVYYSEPQHVQAFGGGVMDRRSLRVLHIGEMRSIDDIPSSDSAILAVEAQMAYVVGASMLVSSEFIRAVGPMCEDYFLYFEELDWAFRGRPRFKLAYAPQSLVFHKVGASSSKPMGEFSLNLLYRNRIRFASRFMPWRMPGVMGSLAYELFRHILKRRWLPARLVVRTLLDTGVLIRSAPRWKPTT